MNNPIIEIGGVKYERRPVQTRLVNFGEDLNSIMRQFVLPAYQTGDWLAISEKLVSVCENNIRHISTVRVGWLARLITRFVKKYPNDIGFSRPEKMQLVVELAGWRIIPAIILGGIGKLIKLRGLFWIIVGNRAAEIDGFNPEAMDMYKENAAMPPVDPKRAVQNIERATHVPSIIIDANNINVKIISASQGVPVSAALARLILLDNPMGQDDELTPFILVRRV